jgi:hypothetical protein
MHEYIAQTMKQIIITLTLLAAVQLGSAQEKLSRDQALKYASRVSADLKQLAGTPIPTDVDAQQPVAVQDGEYGGLVLPQKNLTAANLAQAGETVVPIGQLWLHRLTPMKDGEAVPSEKLRLATVIEAGEKTTMPQCALGVRRSSSGALELLIFGKGKAPLLTAPLKAIDTKPEPPIDLVAERESDSGRITVKIVGKYQASFAVTELEI